MIPKSNACSSRRIVPVTRILNSPLVINGAFP